MENVLAIEVIQNYNGELKPTEALFATSERNVMCRSKRSFMEMRLPAHCLRFVTLSPRSSSSSYECGKDFNLVTANNPAAMNNIMHVPRRDLKWPLI